MKFDKKGSFTVYVAFFAVALTILASALIGAARNMYIEGSISALGRLWATSILGEYDSELYSRYGLMGFYGTDKNVSDKLKTLYSYSFEDKRFIDCKVDSVELYDYSLGDQNNFMKQLKLAGIESLAFSILGNTNSVELGLEYDGVGRYLENERVIQSLPSRGRTDSGMLDRLNSFFGSIDSPRDLIVKGTDSFLINQYIDAKFGDLTGVASPDKSFLLLEKEYIIGGKFSDEENARAVKRRIIALREVANLLYIENDPKMVAEATVIAEIMTLGYGGSIGAQAVMAAWAYAESVNDYRLLINGKRVPNIKDRVTWACDWDSVINGWEGNYVDNHCTNGDTYSDYLAVLTYFLGENTKLLRIMDLIQINMRHYYRSDFLISEHFSGLDYTLDVNGRKYGFSDEY